MDVNRPAGFWIRLGAAIVDGILVTIVLGILGLIIYGQFFFDGYSALDLLSLLYFLLVPVFWYGYTVGKRAVGVRIVQMDGSNVTLWTMIKRDLISGLVYAITIGIAVIVSAFMVGLREDKRSIHDFIAGTYVTYDPPHTSEEKSE
ncbi:RDD family protein [Alteribacter natronophilus]|uniref:RDD family protein n=1 Tax=Alteribacter natronophilus TaxID=2583810 RepID=UPI00110DE87A|nr:RDD family protein [Alteribacter natronophilus]TMW70966.1 RDD family protein [Alteribacter natronophilus]